MPLSTIAGIAQPIYAKLGIGTGKLRCTVYPQKFGTILVNILCSLARHGQQLHGVQPTEDGCLLRASIPSDIWSFEGELVITITRVSGGTSVAAATAFKGQLFDWGKSNRCLDELFGHLQRAA